MNVYDFDGTIYRGDSSIDFFVYCLMRRPRLVLGLPRFFVYCVLYKLGKVSKRKLKEVYFSFLTKLDDAEGFVRQFWNRNEGRIKSWYLQQKSEDDVVITASPEFLVSEICTRLGIHRLIATQVDIDSGKFLSENCHDKEKVKRFQMTFPERRPAAFYSDTQSDLPMARLAERAYLVEDNQIKEWNINPEQVSKSV